MKAVVPTLAILVVLTVAAVAYLNYNRTNEPPLLQGCIQQSNDGPCLYQVSLVQLIANPDAYNGKRVLVSGYIHFAFEDNGLYLNKDDFDFGNFSNGVGVELAPEAEAYSCNDAYVTVKGTFSGRSGGHLGLWSGRIDDIDYCLRQEQRD